MARVIGQKLTESWGQPVLVDNRPGAAGSIGAGIVGKAPPDGYTILMISTSFSFNPSLHTKLPFDTVKDFAAVTWAALTPNILLVHPSLPVKSVKELIALAKSKPGQLNYGSSGYGSAAHLSGELFKNMVGIDIVHIPYKGANPALTDLLAGRLSLAFETMPSALTHVKAGKLRALAVNGARRSPAMPDLPTMTEAGVPGYESTAWFGIVAPAATPKEIITKLNTEIVKILRMPDVKERLSTQGTELVGSTPEEFDAHIKREIAKWGKVIKDAGIPIED